MSTDPNGILFFGFPLPDVGDSYHDFNDEWKQEFRPKEPDDQSSYRTPEWDEWRARVQAWEATPENVQIDWSGGENCEQYFVHCEGLEKSVEWDELLVIESLLVPPEAEAFLHKFCDRFNLPKQPPKWHLASRYF
jgi:hypothetical protein